MRELFLALERRSTALALSLACAMLVAAACLGMFQIITRFVFEQPAEWTEVLIRFSLIWMVFLGMPMAFRQGAMVSVDVRTAGRAHRQARARYAGRAGALVILAVILWFGWSTPSAAACRP